MDSFLPDALQSTKMDAFRDRIDAFHASGYHSLFMQAIDDVEASVLYQSPLHGKHHIGRVLLFGAFLAMDLKLEVGDAKLLLNGCSYHDVGRVSDQIDDDHGRRSGEQIGKILALPDGEPLRLLKAMVEVHSLDDRHIDDVLSRHEVNDLSRGAFLSRILKDADALDRVRIAHLFDPTYLRFAYSKPIIPFAFRVFEVEAELLKARSPSSFAGVAFAVKQGNHRVVNLPR